MYFGNVHCIAIFDLKTLFKIHRPDYIDLSSKYTYSEFEYSGPSDQTRSVNLTHKKVSHYDASTSAWLRPRHTGHELPSARLLGFDFPGKPLLEVGRHPLHLRVLDRFLYDNLVFKTYFSLNVVLHLAQSRLQPCRLLSVPASHQLLLTPGFVKKF